MRLFLILLIILGTASCAKYTEREKELYVMQAMRFSNNYENNLRDPGTWQIRPDEDPPVNRFRRNYFNTPLDQEFQLLSAVEDCEETGALYCSIHLDFVEAEKHGRIAKRSPQDLENAKTDFQDRIDLLNEKVEKARNSLTGL